MEQNEAAIIVVIRSVSMLLKHLFGSMRNRPSLAVSIYKRPDQTGTNSISFDVDMLFVPVRHPIKKKGVQGATLLPIPRYAVCFSRAALNLSVPHNQSAPIHVANSIIPFSSFQCSLGTRP